MSDTSGLNFIDFLAYGAIGIALALAILSYRLLSKEQQREEVREPMLKSIRNYFIMSIVLSLFFGTGEIISMLSSEAGGEGEEATIAKLWDMHVADHPEEEYTQTTTEQKKSKMLELMRTAKDHANRPDNSEVIRKLRDSLNTQIAQGEQLDNSFYVKFETFRRVYSKLKTETASGKYIFLISQPVDSPIFEIMRKLLVIMGKDVSAASKADLISVWSKLKRRWDPRKAEDKKLDHIESFDFPGLVRYYLDSNE